MKATCCGPSRTGASAPAVALAGVPARGDVSGVRLSGRITGEHRQVALPGGTFTMGDAGRDTRLDDGEGPLREVWLSPFAIDVHTVTNAQFAAFVSSTGYLTTSELLGWSFVFAGHVHPDAWHYALPTRPTWTPWWVPISGATWTCPLGPGSGTADRLDHPVVHVSWHDAAAYCAWAGRRLPTESQWEYSARGGRQGARYLWVQELMPKNEHRCNIWHGRFPDHDNAEDGFSGTAPATWFPPNDYGLFQCVGNVWEWCSDWFDPTWHRRADASSRSDPTGPAAGSERSMRGGSHLCHDSYCNRYRVSARTGNTPDSASSHTGFRTVSRAATCEDATQE